MKKVTAYIQLILFALALSVPATAQANAASERHTAQKSYKKYMKQQKKQQKKAVKNWKKQHPVGAQSLG